MTIAKELNGHGVDMKEVFKVAGWPTSTDAIKDGRWGATPDQVEVAPVEPVLRREKPLPVAGVVDMRTPPTQGKVDRKAYQREWLRKKRAEEKLRGKA